MKKYLTLAACVLILITLCSCGGGPEKEYNRITTNVSKGDWGKVYDSLSAKTQAKIDMLVKMALAFQSQKVDEDISGKELFVNLMAKDESGRKDMEKILGGEEVISTEIEGDTATLLVLKGGEQEKIKMIKENNKWKLVADMGI